jgi:hypothetical protein
MSREQLRSERCLVTGTVLVATALFMSSLTAAAAAPLDHLNQAERILTAIPKEPLKKDALKKIDELARHLADLAGAYRANGDSLVPPAAASETDAERETGSEAVNWKASFSQVEKDLAGMLGGLPPLIPSDVQRQLEQVRLEVELFFAAAIFGPVSESQPPQSTPNAQ